MPGTKSNRIRLWSNGYQRKIRQPGWKGIEMILRGLVALSFMLSAVFLAACGGDADSSREPEVAATPPPNQAPQIQGFGPVTIRIMGATPKESYGDEFPGDCDDMAPDDDDLEVMTFSAPWSVVGVGQSGAGAGLGSPAMRTFVFEKSPDVPQKRLRLEFRRELTQRTVADLTAGLSKVADISFGNDTVGLYFVNETKDLRFGYVALFPIAQLEGMPQELEFTGRYVAQVGFTPVGPMHFEGWSEAEILGLFNSFHTARCLGEGLERGFAPLAPTVVYE